MSSSLPCAELASIARAHAPFAGKYAVERVLGQGGMGVIFQARHIRLGQRVAIKVLGSDLRDYPELVERFAREARACGALTSSHAVRVFDIDVTEDGTPFIVMELLTGRDLAGVIERDGPQPVARAVRWIVEACDAIAEAHRLGIVHRDIKPSNLFLAQVEGRQVVKVLDFGIAKRVSIQEVAITQAVAPLGTPQYMSPEQVRCAKDVDARSDVWSLGVTLYELVTGKTPFPHASSSACIASIAADPVPDPRTLRAELPDDLVAVLMKALAKSAADRFQSVDEMVAALAPFARGQDDAAEHSHVDFLLLQAREQLESRPDRTVPPAVSHASAPPNIRSRSKLAMASAAVLGLAALVLTPRCVATAGEGSASAARRTQPTVMATTTLNAAALPAALEIPAVTAAEPPAPSPAAPVAAAHEPSTAAVQRPQLPRAHANASSSASPAAKVLGRPAALAATQTGVHGGLSSPGF
jgi:serine/threonine-protein kinase